MQEGRSRPPRSPKSFRRARAVTARGPSEIALSAIFLSAALAACSAEAPSGEASPEQSICVGYGFAPSTDAFNSCIAQFTQLVQGQRDSQGHCEAVSQQALRTTQFGTFSRGFAASVLEADADYRFCLTENAAPAVKLELPNGQTATCQQIENHIRCE